MAHVYHWKHGWIPLNHTAALSKAKGNHSLASKYLDAAHSPDAGINSRRDVAGAMLDLPNVHEPQERADAGRQIKEAAHRHNAEDLLPSNASQKSFTSNQAARDWANSVWAGPSGYTPAQLAALQDYTAKGHMPMNKLLRSSKGKQTNPQIRQMDSAIERAARVPDDITTVRSADLRQLGLEDATRGDPSGLVGHELIDYGYMSTSIAKGAPSSLSRNVRLEIHVPRGSRGIYVSGGGGRGSGVISSSGGGENELILARGSRLVIKSVRKVGPKWHVVAEVRQGKR